MAKGSSASTMRGSETEKRFDQMANAAKQSNDMKEVDSANTNAMALMYMVPPLNKIADSIRLCNIT